MVMEDNNIDSICMLKLGKIISIIVVAIQLHSCQTYFKRRSSPFYYSQCEILLSYSRGLKLKKLNSEIEINVSKDSSYTFIITDFNGSARGNLIVDGITRLEFYYKGNGEFVDDRIQYFDFVKHENVCVSYSYLQPKKDSTWRFFDTKGNEIKRENWMNDSLINVQTTDR